MSHWQFLYAFGGSDRDIAGSWRNIVGAPVLCAYKIPRGTEGYRTAVAGVYRFTFETVASVTCRRISSWDAKNPLLYSGARTVKADFSTENKNLLPGWSVVLREDVRAGDEFEIGVGCCWKKDKGVWRRITAFGPRMAGFVSTDQSLKVRNISAAPLSDCKLVATNAIRVASSHGALGPFSSFYQSGILNPEADRDLDGSEVTLINYLPGDPATANILIDGDPIDVYDVSADSIVPGGVSLRCDGVTLYRFADGTKYQSGTFCLAEALPEAGTTTIHVSDGGSSAWLASDNGSFVPGPAGIVLTEQSQGRGTITAGGVVPFKLRIQPPDCDAPDLDARIFSLRAVGLDGSVVVDLDHQGSFLRATGGALLSIRITALKSAYPRPRYSPDPNDPGRFIPDDGGEYVEDLSNPGTYLHHSQDQSGGNYRSIWHYLAENGVTFSNVS
jgi:hypothetical protein